MTTSFSNPLIGGAALVITLLSGLLLTSLGKPLNTPVFTVHKLVAVGTVVILGVCVYGLFKAGNASTLHTLLFAVTGLIFAALVVSGALLSLVFGDILTLDAAALQLIQRVHQIVPLVALVTAALSLYVLASSQA